MDTRDAQAANNKGIEGRGKDSGKGKCKKSAANPQDTKGKGKRGAALTPSRDQPVDGNPKAKRPKQNEVELQQKLKALEACEACKKCQWTSASTKGCRQCLGLFYSQLRLTRPALEYYRRLSQEREEEKNKEKDE